MEFLRLRVGHLAECLFLRLFSRSGVLLADVLLRLRVEGQFALHERLHVRTGRSGFSGLLGCIHRGGPLALQVGDLFHGGPRPLHVGYDLLDVAAGFIGGPRNCLEDGLRCLTNLRGDAHGRVGTCDAADGAFLLLATFLSLISQIFYTPLGIVELAC